MTREAQHGEALQWLGGDVWKWWSWSGTCERASTNATHEKHAVARSPDSSRCPPDSAGNPTATARHTQPPASHFPRRTGRFDFRRNIYFIHLRVTRLASPNDNRDTQFSQFIPQCGSVRARETVVRHPGTETTILFFRGWHKAPPRMRPLRVSSEGDCQPPAFGPSWSPATRVLTRQANRTLRCDDCGEARR